MRILSIETSGSTFSAALAENDLLIFEIFRNTGLKHSEKLIPSVSRMISDAGWELSSLDKIAVCTGPGSFTGIRVGMACALTMAQSLDIPVVGINSLDILEAGVPSVGVKVFSALDALRREVFVKNSGGGSKVKIETIDVFIKKLAKEKSALILVGNVLLSYKKEINKILKIGTVPGAEILNYPRAGVLALMAAKRKGLKYDKVKPLYIRRSWAEEKRK